MIAHKYDTVGAWIPGEEMHLDEEQEVPNWYTTKPLPIPNWKPVFNGTEWIETASEEEKNPILLPSPPSVEEQLEEEKAKVRRMETQLNQTNADLQGFMDFYFENMPL